MSVVVLSTVTFVLSTTPQVTIFVELFILVLTLRLQLAPDLDLILFDSENATAEVRRPQQNIEPLYY